MKKIVCTGIVLMSTLVFAPMPAVLAQQGSGTSGSTGTDASPMPLDQLLPMTVHEAWVSSGRDEDKFYAMVKQLAELSAQKRGVTLPDTTQAGQRAGAEFKTLARKDPDQLLYVVVDTMVQHVAAKRAAAAAAPAQ